MTTRHWSDAWAKITLFISGRFGICVGMCWIGLSLGSAHLVAQDTAPERLPRDQLLVYRDEHNHIRPVKSVADWQHRRQEILRGMQAVMGPLPGPEKLCPLAVEVLEEVDRGTYIRRKITYQSEPGCRVPAYLCVPKKLLEQSGRTAPAVLCLHPTDNTVGHGVVVGEGGRANRAYAHELAARGFVTLAPNYPLLASYQPDLKALGWESGTLKAVWDNRRGLDYLCQLPYVRGDKFAAIGHSLGGHNAVYTAVFEERLAVIISSCGLDSFLDYYQGDERNWYPERGWCQTRYMPKMAAYRGRLQAIPFDFHELIGALAPRWVFIIAPQRDHNFRADSVDRIVQAAQPVFALHGYPDRLRVAHPDCEHDFPEEMRLAAYQLIEQVIGTP
ncbi:MAG: hypothetical protein KatS3mg114_1246 [Planctomycetaceae bacterium]|nr:MAG: hypothetical protein KatS3mg114_1246 [Planctomycetaceae bacterium]